MTTVPGDLLEMVLRECAAAQPRPWYPAEYAQQTGLPRPLLEESLDRLRLGGLIRLTEWEPGKGQGYVLTPVGERVLSRPRLLERLRAGEVPPLHRRAADALSLGPPVHPRAARAQAIREALLSTAPPWITRLLLGSNVLLFLLGLLFAQAQGVGSAYLATPLTAAQAGPEAVQVEQLRHQWGALERRDLYRLGQWWRLLTTCFVHIGFLHLLMNMYALFVLGGALEQIWGRAPYLFLYLSSGVIGNCAAMLFSPAPGLAGASGCLCGLLGSLIVWILLQRRYLPQELYSNWLRATLTNIILIVFISLLPGVSAAAHFGGGLAGAVLAVPLGLSYFEKGWRRWVSWLVAVGLALMPLGALYLALADSAPSQLQHDYALPLAQADQQALEVYKKHIRPLCQRVLAGELLGEEELAQAREQVAAGSAPLRQLANELPAATLFREPRLRAACQSAQEFLQAWLDLFEHFQRCCTPPQQLTPQEVQHLREQMETVSRTRQLLQDSVLFSQ
jgi:rhomboid protease GluP